MNYLKKLWPYLLALGVFVAVSCIYMSPELDGKIIATSDGVQGRGACKESWDFLAENGRSAFWTGSMFSGMPTYQVGGNRFMSDTFIGPIKRTLLHGHESPLFIVLLYCVAFFTLLRSMKVDRWLAIVGALATAFSSYFFIIIAASHNGKTSTLALMSVALAGMYLIFHGHRKTGAVLSLLGTMAGFYPHPQMAYYVCFIFAAFGAAELYLAIVGKEVKKFCLNALLALATLGIGIGTGTAATFANLEYAKETMRGGHSDLVKSTDATNRTEGLDLDYATAWSYGIDECWTFLIPNYMGGSSNYPVGSDSELCQSMIKKGVPRSSAQQFCQSAPMYWGPQPFTSGPVYMGAVVCLLFLLGLMVVKGPYKWALLAVTVLSICLSWGNHWMWFTRLWFDHVPMYNKFRAVSSILVIAEITMPLLGFLALRELVEAKRQSLADNLKLMGNRVLLSGGILVGLLLVALAATSGFSAASDSQMPEWLVPMLVDARKAMFKADVWRSMGFVVAATALLWCYVRSERFKGTAVLAVALGALVMLDMWPVNQRFMNDATFTAGNSFERAFKEKAWEKQLIAQDKDPHYRVFNLTVSPFNDATTSYRMKSIGGYSAAKLRRYQDIIEQHLAKMHQPVIDMLNTKYFIVPDNANGNAPVVQYNPGAMGNAWFVRDVMVVDTPNAECDALMQVNLHTTAIVGQDFAQYAIGQNADSTASVRLTSYAADCLEYEAQNAEKATLVFSEVYYPYGWKAYVDDKETDIFRANYLLRAINVEPGHHRIRMEFRPDSVAKGNTLSMVFVVLMYGIILFCIGKGIYDELKIKK
ncbi:MAG: hypothetical protein E7070_07820 [Bacteroidales bacterium]|nr:hypothetical protein [Bacteroidales bacterium]